MKLYRRITTLVLCLLAVCRPAFAESESWYQVEVIVFEYTRPVTDGESWYGNPGLPGHRNSIDLVTGLAPKRQPEPVNGETKVNEADAEVDPVYRTPYLVLPDEAQNLAGTYRVLKLSSDYRPLFHASWQQPGRGEEQARYVHFKGERPDGDGGKTVEETPTGEEEEQVNAPEQTQLHETREMAFDAMLRLRSTRFLHLDVDAAYFPVDPAVLQSDSVTENVPAYRFADYVRMQESRRILLKELHYFDHPLFGIIVQVTRIEDEKSEE